MPASASNASPKKRASAAGRGRFPPTSRSTLLAAGLIVLADQASKALALRFLADTPTIPVLPGIFHLTLTINSGVAFGLFRGYGFVLTVLTLTLLGALVISSMRRGKAARSGGIRWGLILVVSGALGNLVDRVRFGGVVDFLDFRIWPIFNLADSCITVGAALMAWALWKAR